MDDSKKTNEAEAVKKAKAERQATQKSKFFAWFRSVFSVGGIGLERSRPKRSKLQKVQKYNERRAARAARLKAGPAFILESDRRGRHRTSQERMACRKGWDKNH